jgi:UDP-glucose 4-epimerase
MNWLITGGCGFIGTSLISNLLSEGGHNVRVVDNLCVGSREDLARVCAYLEPANTANLSSPKGVELVVGDVLDNELAHSVVVGCDVVVHLAANTGVGPSVEDPRQDMMVNVIGTFNYLEAARSNQINRFVFASSGAPIGEATPPIHEELAAHPVSPYGASKLAGEGYCSAYSRTYGLDTVALRFGNVYGPGSVHKASVVAKFIKRAMGGETLEIFGDGSQTRDFIFIDDLVAAIRQAASTQGIGGQVFQIATSSETTVSEIAQIIIGKLAERGKVAVNLVNKGKRIGDVQRNFSDTRKAKQILGWKADHNLHSGIEKTVDYFLENVDGQHLER